jgi:hypothetical protein
MRKFFWLMTLGMTVLGGSYLIYVVVTATNPTQQTAGVALSLATVAIPYVFTRCLEGIRHADIMRVRIVGDRPMPPRERPLAPPDPHVEDAFAPDPAPPRSVD